MFLTEQGQDKLITDIILEILLSYGIV